VNRTGHSAIMAFQCAATVALCRTVSVIKLIIMRTMNTGAKYRIIGNAYKISAAENSSTGIRSNGISIILATNNCRPSFWCKFTIRRPIAVDSTYKSERRTAWHRAHIIDIWNW
jgi:hypothetical protein